MPLGDSITWGTNPDDPYSPGYRDSLYIKLIATEYNIDFVGSLSGYGTDPNNEGHPGWFAGPPSPDLYGEHNIADSIYYFLNLHKPDIILLHIGTNDMGETGAPWVKTASEVADAVNSILDSIYNFASDPNHNTVIFLAQIIDDADNRGDSTSQGDIYSTQIHEKTLDFNSYLMNTILPGRPSDQKIVLVNMYNALGQNYHTPGNPYFDTQYVVHPNTFGYNKMAETWFAAIQNYFQPVLAGPDSGGTGKPINVGLSWNAPKAASDMLSHSESFNYELQVATNPDFSLAHIVFSNSSIPGGTTSSSPSGLQYGTQYFWRVRIANYGWSNIWNFTTEPGIPSIDSIYVTSVLANSAVLNAKVNTKNQSTIVRFQWDTNNDTVWPNDQPASNSPLTSDGVGTLSISSLTPNTTYYFRSYVSNGSGTDTSIIKSFTTVPGAPTIDSAYATSITTNSASLNSKVNTGNQSTIVRFQWDTNNDTAWPNDQPASNSPLTSDGVGTLSISSLTPNTTYYFRSYVSNGSGTDTSIIKSFTTVPGAPTIDSAYATSITTNSASLNSKVNTGNQSTIVRFQWDTNNDTVWPNDQPASNSPLTSDGVGTLSISSLTPNTTYYFRSYVSNGSGTDTSIIKSFTTVPGAPTIDSVYATSVASDSASLNSEINTGNQSTTIRFQWDTNNDTVWQNDQPASNSPLTSDGDATLGITGLLPNTTYYFRSYVTNPTGHDTSAIKSFTTLPYAAVKAKIFLEGPYAGGDTMYTTLWQNSLVPASQPYGSPPWSYSGGENVSSFPTNVVDWVLIQLRSDTSTVTSTRAAFLKYDGSIVDTDGTSSVKFNGILGGDYYIVIIHRNHISVMCKNKITLPNATVYDFSTSQTQGYGTNPMADLGGIFGLMSGDGNGNGQVQNNDSESIWKPDNGTSGYKNSDFNLNGQVQNNDNESYWKPNNGKGTQVPAKSN